MHLFTWKKQRAEHSRSTVLVNGIHPVFSDGLRYIGKICKSPHPPVRIAQFKEEINKTLQGIPVEVHPPVGLSAPLSASLGAPGPTYLPSPPPLPQQGQIPLLTITGSGFGPHVGPMGMVVFFYQLNSYSPSRVLILYISLQSTNTTNNIVSWTDTKIRVKVPRGQVVDLFLLITDSSDPKQYYFHLL